MVHYIIREHQPGSLAVAFDLPGETFRDEMVADYKAGRAETPNDLPPQFEMIREVMEALAIPVVEAPGFEADDVLATLGHRGPRPRLRRRRGHRRPRQLPAHRGPAHPRALQPARGERLLALRRGGHRRAQRRAAVAST